MTGKKVLLIEDDESDVQFIRHIFANLLPNLELFSVNTAHEGLEELSSGEYDLLLLDLRLPDMDGLDLINELDPSWVQHIIILSGLDDDELVSKSRMLDVFAYIVKPIDSDALASLVRSILIEY